MKYFFVILIVSGIVLQNLSKIIIIVNFQINKEYIAKNLCVQKEVEDNCCQGSCHLREELNKEEKKEQAPANTIKEVKEFQIFCQTKFSVQFILDQLIANNTPYLTPKPKSVSFSVFHPPKV